MHNAFMPTSITIRNVPDQVRDELAARAARSGRSLQEYLRMEMVVLASKPDIETLLKRVRDRKRAIPTEISAKRIVELRDSDRR